MRGSSRQRDWNALLGSFWFRAARADAVVAAWCEPSDPMVAALGALRTARRWVPSALNPADAPTRPAQKQLELQELGRAGFVPEPWSWPARAPWLSA